MTNKTVSNPPWEIRTLNSLRSGRIVGYTVERIHNPRTPQARAEVLNRGRVYRTHADALDAIMRDDPRIDGYNPEFLGAKPAKAGEDY